MMRDLEPCLQQRSLHRVVPTGSSVTSDTDSGSVAEMPSEERRSIQFKFILATGSESASSFQRRHHLQLCHVVDDTFNRLLRVHIAVPTQLPIPIHGH
jgi:hypothetical protein